MGKLFDVAISFAMENVQLADTVYHYLKAEGLRRLRNARVF